MIIRFLLSSANILFDSGVEAGVRQVDIKVYVLGLTWGGTCTQPAYVEVMRTCDYTQTRIRQASFCYTRKYTAHCDS